MYFVCLDKSWNPPSPIVVADDVRSVVITTKQVAGSTEDKRIDIDSDDELPSYITHQTVDSLTLPREWEPMDINGVRIQPGLRSQPPQGYVDNQSYGNVISKGYSGFMFVVCELVFYLCIHSSSLSRDVFIYLFIGKENLFYCLKYDTVPLCSSFCSESVKIKTESCRQMNLAKFSNLFTVYISSSNSHNIVSTLFVKMSLFRLWFLSVPF